MVDITEVENGISTNTPLEKNTPPHSRHSDSPLLGPAALSLLTLIAGPMASGPAIGAVLTKINRRKTGRLVMFLMPPVGLAINLLLILWPVKWYWATLTLVAIHTGAAAVVFIGMRKHYLGQPDLYRVKFSHRRRQTRRYLFGGMVSGAAMGTLFGGAGTVFFLLLSDRMFSTYMPVASDDMQSLVIFFVSVFCLGISGAIAGGQIGKIGLRLTPARMMIYALMLVWAGLTWLFALQLTIAIPGFQAGQAGGTAQSAAFFPFFAGNLLIGVWWAPFLLSYQIRPLKWSSKLLRSVQIPLINLSAAIVLAIFFGYPTHLFHAAGRYLEREAHIPRALWCYEHGLEKNPAPLTASYLQYRVALLAHKLGERERALAGFRKVVSKYTDHQELVKKSNRFLDNLARATGEGKRVVLPGVETRTAYKGAYCAPNSLALIMRYWGSAVDARHIGRRITGLGSGTMVVDQAWYAEQAGFRHDFLPLASIGDVKACIDAGFPVLVYVPAHVFAVLGYDDTLETLVTYDVATRDVWVDYLQKDFIKSWKKQVTTLVLAYPPGEEDRLPENIRNRLVKSSDDYLHFHLHYLDTPTGYASSAHLQKAAGEKEGFFLPLAILYNDFPGLRPTLAARHDTVYTANAIFDYFSNDFDEGVHLWGQRHYNNYADKDDVLDYSLTYLIGQEQLPLARDLIRRIEEQGPVSHNTLATRAMIDLALGDLENGVHRLSKARRANLTLYLALGEMALGNRQAAISNLVETVDGCMYYYPRRPVGPRKRTGYTPETGPYGRDEENPFTDTKVKMGLDKFGMPVMAVANTLLTGENDFGDAAKKLEQGWSKWLHHTPFDTGVAQKLAFLYKTRLDKMDSIRDAANRQLLERKLELVENRAGRYRKDRFR